MADYRHDHSEPAIAASQINAWVPVRGLSGASSRDEHVMAYQASSIPAIGMSIATVASPGDPAAIVTEGVAKGIAAASVGAWAPVGFNASGLLAPLTGAAAASVVQQQIGITKKAGAAGQVIPIIVKPGQFV